MRLDPGAQVDRYEILSVLGKGGMATVYAVRHRDLGTWHAMKVLHVNLPGLNDRMLFEGRIQAQLRHRNVCRVSDVVRAGSAIGLVMDLVRGPALDQVLRQLSPNLLQIDHLADGILRGLYAAHQAGLVHRDVKPANVLLDVSEGRVVPKVTDFGLARALEVRPGSRETVAGTQMGTPGYMAPEQYRDAKSVDERADIFSLGCLLYELATSAEAFPGEAAFELYEAAAAARYTNPGQIAPHLPQRVVDTLVKALSPHAANRFATVEEMRLAWFAGASVPGDDVFEASHLELVAACTRPLPSDPRPQTPAARGPRPVGTLVPSLAVAADFTTSEEPAPMLLADPTPVPTVPPRPFTAARALVGVGGALLGVVVVLVVSLLAGVGATWWWLGRSNLDVGSTDPAIEAPTSVDAPTPTAPDPVLAEPAPDEPAPVAPVEPANAPVDPAPAPKPRPKPAPPPSGGTVLVTGVDRAWIVAPDGARVRPGSLPAGRYSVVVFFDEGRPTTVIEGIDVTPGSSRTVRCDASLKVCR